MGDHGGAAEEPGTPLFEELNRVLEAAGFDAFVEGLCAAFYADRLGRPSLRPGRYFRMLFIGYFEGLSSERGIAWRVSDSLGLRAFLDLDVTEATPNHSTLSRTRRLIDVETHVAVFTWVLERLAQAGLVKGKTVGVDATTLEANAAMRSIKRRDTGGTATVEVRRLSALVKASKQPPKAGRAARVAEVTLRYQPVALPCPGAEPVELFVVHAREEQPPPAVKPLEWFVLTTLRVTIKMVVGWRIQLMVQLGRETPDLPQDLLFSDGELRVLATLARSRNLPPPTRLGDAVGLTARLGGWLGRKRDPPGAQLLWYGYAKLGAMAFAFELRDEFG